MPSATTQPTTEAGRDLLETWYPKDDVTLQAIARDAIAAIEAEAAAAERAAIRAEVEAEMAEDGGRLSALAIIDAREP